MGCSHTCSTSSVRRHGDLGGIPNGAVGVDRGVRRGRAAGVGGRGDRARRDRHREPGLDDADDGGQAGGRSRRRGSTAGIARRRTGWPRRPSRASARRSGRWRRPRSSETARRSRPQARAGGLSAEQTEVLAKAVAVDPAAEDRLLGVAARDGLGKLNDECRGRLALSGDDVQARHAKIHRERIDAALDRRRGRLSAVGQAHPRRRGHGAGSVGPVREGRVRPGPHRRASRTARGVSGRRAGRAGRRLRRCPDRRPPSADAREARSRPARSLRSRCWSTSKRCCEATPSRERPARSPGSVRSRCRASTTWPPRRSGMCWSPTAKTSGPTARRPATSPRCCRSRSPPATANVRSSAATAPKVSRSTTSSRSKKAALPPTQPGRRPCHHDHHENKHRRGLTLTPDDERRPP